jgi:hypothetical protein
MIKLQTEYGEFVVTETTTGIMAENLSTGDQFFIDGRYTPNRDDVVDIKNTIESIEYEYEFKYNV